MLDNISTPDHQSIRRARALLLHAAQLPSPAVAEFLRTSDPVAAADRIRNSDLPPHLRAIPIPGQAASQRQISDEFAAAARIGARLVIPEDDEWPAAQLAALAHGPTGNVLGPPIALWVRSTRPLDTLLTRAVSIVGARVATPHGEHVATDLAYQLAKQDVTIVTSAAYGINEAALRGAHSAADGSTVIVLPSGIDINRPAALASRFADGLDHGALISEYPLGTAPARHRFLRAGLLIAALGQGTLIVEAGPRSGARSTTAAATNLGRVVMAVPGPITCIASTGCHELLRAGAVLVTSAHHIHDALQLDGTSPPTTPGSPADTAGSS